MSNYIIISWKIRSIMTSVTIPSWLITSFYSFDIIILSTIWIMKRNLKVYLSIRLIYLVISNSLWILLLVNIFFILNRLFFLNKSSIREFIYIQNWFLTLSINILMIIHVIIFILINILKITINICVRISLL